MERKEIYLGYLQNKSNFYAKTDMIKDKEGKELLGKNVKRSDHCKVNWTLELRADNKAEAALLNQPNLKPFRMIELQHYL